ncbi:hypothetical protein Nepgr_008169 [Nepenthes gracilis]|uniref:Transmembrane protein 53 n=1 Tax=Nepenthes gracilis TaxID=150966 RepID=A0AAD3XJ09_NEPGR|nr:hypothetical protein Nepgr_008169 [Nepenthes gracilis]
MEASVGVFNPLNLNGQISGTAFRKVRHLTYHPGRKPHQRPLRHPHLLRVSHSRKCSLSMLCIAGNASNDHVCSTPSHSSSLSPPNSCPFGFLICPISSVCSRPDHPHSLNQLNACFNDGGSINWHSAWRTTNGDGSFVSSETEYVVTVVLLGWLGANPRHLKRYAEFYTSKGMNAVTFVVSVRNALWFDLGVSVENRITELANRLVSWLLESEMDGRERCFIFHTFSNTGWLVYGAILSRLQGRPDVLHRIRGCIVDSGGAPELNPRIWAAGFGAALFKKSDHVVCSSVEAGELGRNGTMSKMQEKEPSIIERLLLFVLEKAFSFLLKLHNVNQRLSNVMVILSKNQPSCPQFYLFSTADKVIPFRSIELFIEDQRRIGRKVRSFNFKSSSHVGHYRAFPNLYSLEINNFLKESLCTVKQT